MRLKWHFCLLLLFITIVCLNCSQKDSAKSGEVLIHDKTENLSNGVVLDDQDAGLTIQDEPNKSKASTEPAVTLADKSEIVTMVDGYGNKTETRYFKGHPRLQLVLIRTATNGTKQVTVYGYGSDIKMMNDDFAEKALNASANEIANAADLKATRPYKDTFAITNLKPQTAGSAAKARTPKPATVIQPAEPEAPNSVQTPQNDSPVQNENRLLDEEK